MNTRDVLETTALINGEDLCEIKFEPGGDPVS